MIDTGLEPETHLDYFASVFPAQLTATAPDADNVPCYAWEEQSFDATTGAYTTANPGRSGDCGDPDADPVVDPNSQAYEINNQTVAIGSYVTMRLRGLVNGVPVYEFSVGLAPGTAWVRILCPTSGTYGYPGLVQLYDSASQSYSDLDGTFTTVTASIPDGVSSVTPGSMDGITIGSILLVIDGLCVSQSVVVTGTNVTAAGMAVLVGDVVDHVTITNGGSGYPSIPSVTFTSGGGSGATGKARLAGGAVSGVTITNPGSGYSEAPDVAFDPSPATPTSFTATFSLAVSYPVTGVTVTGPGSGYSGTPPTVTFSGGSGSGPPTAEAVLDPTGDFVASVSMLTNGQDYNPTPPTVTFSDPPSGTTATGTAVIGGPVRIFLAGVWVPFNPAEFIPVQNDVDEKIIYLARQEMNAPDGVQVFLALGGATVIVSCTDGSSFTYYAGRLVAYTPAPS